MYGVDQIPATDPMGCRGENGFDAVHDEIAETRAVLAGLGLSEAQGQTLISDESAAWVLADSIALEHPLSSDMNHLRPSLLPGLLDSLRNNFTRQIHDVGLFEVGRVFLPGIRETRKVAMAVAGNRFPEFWQGDNAPVDAADLKGIVEALLDGLGVFGAGFDRRGEPTALFAESAEIKLGKNVIGQMGQLLPMLGKRCECRGPVFLAELDLDTLLQRRGAGKSFKPLAQFPGSKRDVAMLVPSSFAIEAFFDLHLESIANSRFLARCEEVDTLVVALERSVSMSGKRPQLCGQSVEKELGRTRRLELLRRGIAYLFGLKMELEDTDEHARANEDGDDDLDERKSVPAAGSCVLSHRCPPRCPSEGRGVLAHARDVRQGRTPRRSRSGPRSRRERCASASARSPCLRAAP